MLAGTAAVAVPAMPRDVASSADADLLKSSFKREERRGRGGGERASAAGWGGKCPPRSCWQLSRERCPGDAGGCWVQQKGLWLLTEPVMLQMGEIPWAG